MSLSLGNRTSSFLMSTQWNLAQTVGVAKYGGGVMNLATIGQPEQEWLRETTQHDPLPLYRIHDRDIGQTDSHHITNLYQ